MKTSDQPSGHRIDYLAVDDLEDANRNPKAHAGEEVQRSMGRFGYVEPIVIDERTMRLVAGHGRKEALLAMKKSGTNPPNGIRIDEDGRWLVPVMRGWRSNSDQEADAYLLASNRLTEVGGWHDGALGEILAELRDADALDGLGFDNEFVSKLLDGPPKGGKTDPDDVPDEPTGPLRVELGDVWLLGDHRIICEDCTNADVVDHLLKGEKPRMCWTDPPWNVAYGETGNPAGWSKKHKPIANDNLGERFPDFCRDFIRQIARALVPGGQLYMAMSAQEWPTIHGALTAAGFHWSSTIIWSKDSLVLSRKDYHTQYEPVWYGWKDGAARLVPLEDRTQSDVWPIDRPKRSDAHPTMKPVELITRSLKNSSLLGDVVFEPFSGSGSTLIACEQTGRKCRAIELEPKYVQVAIERWEAFTGRIATKG